MYSASLHEGLVVRQTFKKSGGVSMRQNAKAMNKMVGEFRHHKGNRSSTWIVMKFCNI
jgi:hypothetical protein